MTPVVELKEAADIQMGTAPPGISYNENGEGLPMIAGAGDYGETHPEPKKWTTAPTRITSVGDLIVCVRATIGDLNWSDKEYCLGRGVAGIKAKDGIADIGYLAHYIGSKKKELCKLGTGSTFLAIRRDDLSTFPVPLPPLEEQKRITTILDKADAIRRKRQQAIELSDQFLRSVFLDMFGDPLANPKGWERLAMRECTYIDAPMVDPKKAEFETLYHIGADKIRKTTGEILPCLTAQEEGIISSKFLFDSQYILYTKIRPYLRKVALPDYQGLCSADIYPVRPDVEILTKEYLWSVLISEEFVRYTETLPSRASIPKLNRAEFGQYQIAVPPFAQQEIFSEVFNSVRNKTIKLVEGLRLSENLMAALTQQAFNGGIMPSKAA